MSRQDKKQRHKAKRQAKRHAARRRDSISPVKRLAESKGDLEIWMSEDFEDMGQAEVFAYKRGAGLTGIACFLIDRGVVGLKDAWTKLGIDRTDLEDILAKSQSHNISLRKCTPEEARNLIAGGVRWAHDNGMRLPRDWMKAAAFIGGVGDWSLADTSRFEKEFAGHPEDLRRRLIGCPLDEYLRRSDIKFIFSDAAPYMDQQTGEYASDDQLYDDDDDDESLADDLPLEELAAFLEKFSELEATLIAETELWLKAQGDMPSPELPEAWRSMLAAGMLSKSLSADTAEDVGERIMDEIAARIDPSRIVEYERAVKQVSKHLENDRQLLQKAVKSIQASETMAKEPEIA